MTGWGQDQDPLTARPESGRPHGDWERVAVRRGIDQKLLIAHGKAESVFDLGRPRFSHSLPFDELLLMNSSPDWYEPITVTIYGRPFSSTTAHSVITPGISPGLNATGTLAGNALLIAPFLGFRKIARA